jgi:putative DNA primase/helicase
MDFKKLHDQLIQISQQICQNWLPDGKRTGKNWTARSPLRHDANAGSFKVDLSTGVYKDFSTGEGGDLIELYAKIKGITNIEAANELAAQYTNANFETFKAKEPILKADSADWVSVLAPRPAQDRDLNHWKLGAPAEYYCYKNAEGGILGYVCRFETGTNIATGKTEKETWPLCYAKNVQTGETRFKWKGFEKPRPLYGLNLLHSNPEKYILLVEGEKCADAVNKILPHAVIGCAWVGGTNGLSMVDLSALKGRKIIYWPDNDEVGIKCARDIIKFLAPICDSLRLIIPDLRWPAGYDVADAVAKGAKAEALESFIRKSLRTPEEFIAHFEKPAGIPLDYEEHAPQMIPPPEMYLDDLDGEPAFESAPEVDLDAAPFRMLGVTGGVYHYFCHSTGDVVALRAAEHRSHSLLPLASLNWWTKKFPSKTGADFNLAANYLINNCCRQVYDSDKLRGCGAWFDGGRTVVHLGEELIIDGELMPINNFTDTAYIYTRSKRSKLKFSNKIDAGDAVKFLRICENLNWENPMHAQLFAGWAVLAPICGALKQRPHAWITAEAGSGKSWVFETILSPVIGDEVEYLGVGTTEAAIRASMGNKAIPILFDEAEGETSDARKRLQNILDLLKMATREGGAATKKSDAKGGVKTYMIRSMAMLSSVGVNISSQADQTRFAVFKLKKAPDTTEDTLRFEKFNAEVNATLSADYCNGLRARTISLIPTIRENIKILERAIIKVLPNSRASKNIAALLAGTFTLLSDDVLSDETAEKWTAGLNWDEFKLKDTEKDHNKLCEYILQTHINAITADTGIGARLPIEEILMRATARAAIDAGEDDYNPLTAERAKLSLMRCGIKLQTMQDVKYVCFTKDQNLERALSETPFAKNYMQFLARLEGAHEGKVQMQMKRRDAILVPLSSLLGIKQQDFKIQEKAKESGYLDEFNFN